MRLGDGRPGTPIAPHYPDLMLIMERGRIAIELELFPPGGRRLEAIIVAYGANPNIAAAVYLVENRAVGYTVEATAARLGLADPAHVQAVKFDRTAPSATAQ